MTVGVDATTTTGLPKNNILKPSDGFSHVRWIIIRVTENKRLCDPLFNYK